MMLVILMLLPFIEGWITGDKRDHHLLQRPRNAPTRTAVMVSLMTFYGLAWAAGGNDIIAIKLHASINQITYFMRVAVFVGPADRVLDHPPLVHLAAASRQREAAARLRDGHHHALPRGRLRRAAPADQRDGRLHAHRARPRRGLHGRERHRRRRRGRTRLALGEAAGQAVVVDVQPQRAEAHRGPSSRRRTTTPSTRQELQAGLDHPVDGHQFDDHRLRDTDDVPLRDH